MGSSLSGSLVGITCCVNYLEWLEVTVSRNRKHFKRWWIVTVPGDVVLSWEGLRDYELDVFVTDVFEWDKGKFRKWTAIQRLVDEVLRKDLRNWMAMLDADVVWPDELPNMDWQAGYLYIPRRRNYEDWVPGMDVPDGSEWGEFELHRYRGGGYTQIFYGMDPLLVDRKWFSDSWEYADGGDWEFYMKWRRMGRAVDLDWEVLHLGKSGRVTGWWKGRRD